MDEGWGSGTGSDGKRVANMVENTGREYGTLDQRARIRKVLLTKNKQITQDL